MKGKDRDGEREMGIRRDNERRGARETGRKTDGGGSKRQKWDKDRMHRKRRRGRVGDRDRIGKGKRSRDRRRKTETEQDQEK